MMIWELVHPQARPENLGLLPSMLDEDDPRSAREQFNSNYQHGGGWFPMQGFKLSADGKRLLYPGDPPMLALARVKLRDELVVLYECEWVAIIQPDGSFETCRMD